MAQQPMALPLGPPAPAPAAGAPARCHAAGAGAPAAAVPDGGLQAPAQHSSHSPMLASVLLTPRAWALQPAATQVAEPAHPPAASRLPKACHAWLLLLLLLPKSAASAAAPAARPEVAAIRPAATTASGAAVPAAPAAAPAAVVARSAVATEWGRRAMQPSSALPPGRQTVSCGSRPAGRAAGGRAGAGAAARTRLACRPRSCCWCRRWHRLRLCPALVSALGLVNQFLEGPVKRRTQWKTVQVGGWAANECSGHTARIQTQRTGIRSSWGPASPA